MENKFNQNIVKEGEDQIGDAFYSQKHKSLAEHVVNKLIEDFFEDNLYKFFFLPEKIKGIKTNFNYVKLYLSNLITFI